MSLYNDCSYRGGCQIQRIESQIYPNDSQSKVEILNTLLKDRLELVGIDGEQNLLDLKLQKISYESLKGLCEELGEIFKTGYEDDVKRVLIFEKFIDAAESQWPFLIKKLQDEDVLG